MFVIHISSSTANKPIESWLAENATKTTKQTSQWHIHKDRFHSYVLRESNVSREMVHLLAMTTMTNMESGIIKIKYY